jgi:hypothetical protein
MVRAMELKPNRELFPRHLSFILHGALVGASSLWPLWYSIAVPAYLWSPHYTTECANRVHFVLSFIPMAWPTNQPSDSISCLSMVLYATEHTSVGWFLHFKDNLWFWGSTTKLGSRF